MTEQELISAGYVLHHSSVAHTKRKPNVFEPYKGRYGEGYSVIRTCGKPSYAGRRFANRVAVIEYYVKQETKGE